MQQTLLFSPGAYRLLLRLRHPSALLLLSALGPPRLRHPSASGTPPPPAPLRLRHPSASGTPPPPAPLSASVAPTRSGQPERHRGRSRRAGTAKCHWRAIQRGCTARCGASRKRGGACWGMAATRARALIVRRDHGRLPLGAFSRGKFRRNRVIPRARGCSLPDLIAIRLAEVPDSWPPYDDEVAIAGAGQAMRPEGDAAEEWAVSGGTGPRRAWTAETGGPTAETGGLDQAGKAGGDGEAPRRRGEAHGVPGPG